MCIRDSPVTTRKRRTTARRTGSRSRSTARRPRRRTSTASTVGAAAGAALAGLLVALLTGLPWWGWVLLVVMGLVVGAVWAVRRGRAVDDAGADPPPVDSAPPAHPVP